MVRSQAAMAVKAAELFKAEPCMLFLKMKVTVVTNVTGVLHGISGANVCMYVSLTELFWWQKNRFYSFSGLMKTEFWVQVQNNLHSGQSCNWL